MPDTLADKLIRSHRIDGSLEPGKPVALEIDQTLTQDATGTLVMLELDAIGLDRVRTEVSVQYVDHNLLQTDEKNADDHLFLESACRRFGVWYSRPGNGVSHPVHMQRFGVPGKTLIGSDSHTPAAGSLGMLAFGAGGLEVAMAMAGKPLRIAMPAIFGVRLTGHLPDWVSAKDVILEMLRRHDVDGAQGMIVEYFGPGVETLSAMDRHVIANMGTELGATSTVFPSDEEVKRFLVSEGRGDDWIELFADEGAEYAKLDEIDLGSLEPLIALPSSPGNVVPVSEVEGKEIYQAYLGSSANPGYRDFAVPAAMVEGKVIPPAVSFDVNPTSRQLVDALVADGSLRKLLDAGARLHQTGCNGCIGMGQAPASGRNSLRTVPRNFPGRSGAKEDSVFLCSPETATASALAGRITDPRTTEMDFPRIGPPKDRRPFTQLLEPPLEEDEARRVELIRSKNIEPLPEFEALPEDAELPVLLKLGDNISTDEILPAGSRALPYRSNIPKISEFAFDQCDEQYVSKAKKVLDDKLAGHVVVAGRNYGQGSSREHAVVATRFLGLRAVLAKSIARIHKQNLINYGVVPFLFENADDYDRIDAGDVLDIAGVRDALESGTEAIDLELVDKDESVTVVLPTAQHERRLILEGGLINTAKMD